MFKLYDGTTMNHENLRPVLCNRYVFIPFNASNKTMKKHYLKVSSNDFIDPFKPYELINILVHKGKYDSYVLKNVCSGKIRNAKKIYIENPYVSYPALCDTVSRYKKPFKKCNLTAGKLDDLQKNYIIRETITKKENGKVIKEETKIIDIEYYINVISSAAFFHDHVTLSYSIAGMLPYRLKAISPDKSITVCRYYDYECK